MNYDHYNAEENFPAPGSSAAREAREATVAKHKGHTNALECPSIEPVR